MKLSEELLEILACPKCKGPLQKVDVVLVCPCCHLKYPIRGGIPVLLVEEATEIREV